MAPDTLPIFEILRKTAHKISLVNILRNRKEKSELVQRFSYVVIMVSVGIRFLLILFVFTIGMEFQKVNGKKHVDGANEKFRSNKLNNQGTLKPTPNIALHSGIVGGFIPHHNHRRDFNHITNIIAKAIKSDDLYRDYHAKRIMKSKRYSTRSRGSRVQYMRYGREVFHPSQMKRNKVASLHQLRWRKRSSTKSQLSSTAAIMRKSDGYHRIGHWQFFQNNIKKVRSKMEKIEIFDAAIIVTYACAQIAITLPVILIPVIAADPFAPNALSFMDPTISPNAMVGRVVSLSSLGLGTGKLLNGFICQAIGGRVAGSVYLLGMGAFALFLSMTSSSHAYAIAGMEFCASMMWTASLVLLSSRYSHDVKKFGTAMMSLSLASTSGTMISKFLGGALLSQFHWRQVALFATIFSMVGSALLYVFTKENELSPPRERQIFLSTKSTEELVNAGPSFKSIESSIRSVLFKGPIFWCVAFAHFTSYIVRSSDKILGSCLVDVANVPRKSQSLTIRFYVNLSLYLRCIQYPLFYSRYRGYAYIEHHCWFCHWFTIGSESS
jgi:hypothetical protein